MAVEMMLYRYFSEMLFIEERGEALISNTANVCNINEIQA